MSLKDTYVDNLKAQLDKWSADIDVLEARARQVDADLRIKYDEQLATMRTKRDEATVKMQEIQQSAGDAWQEVRKGGDEAWDSIRRAIAEARKKFEE